MILTAVYLGCLVIIVIGFLTAILITLSAATILIVQVPFVPTPKKNVKIIIDQLNLKPGQIFYDLGCGDGRFLIATAQAGASAIGFEVSPFAYVKAKLNIWLNRSSAKIFYQNFYRQNISNADAVFCFLMDVVMPKVEKKLLTELKPGAKVVCYGFKLPNWQPSKIIDLNPANKKSSNIYLYLKK
ncbi:MAG: 50S ribosomal protein L11 methyltransferase [Patescibacteria group bacterium]|jgi:SAM-dependent methyltransferase|nr:50S ribosomal protein L11 methyltransferase [Patescibacteria group bacterium]